MKEKNIKRKTSCVKVILKYMMNLFKEVSYAETLKFGINQENRKINRSHLVKIKRQLLTSFDLIPAITVNTITNNIIDGQHRLKAFQELIENHELSSDKKLKVMFVEIPVEEEKQAIVDANTNSKNWSVDDYINSYVKCGVVSYVKLEEWCLSHPLTTEDGKAKYRYGASIITGKRCQSALKNGVFSFTEEDYNRAEMVHAELLEIIDLFGLKGKGQWLESLAVSWIKVRELHEFRCWIKEFKLKKQKFLKMPKENSFEWDNIFSIANTAINIKK